MNRPRRVNARERLKPTPELPYGPDPWDASVQRAYLKMQDEITLGIIDLRSHPIETITLTPQEQSASSPAHHRLRHVRNRDGADETMNLRGARMNQPQTEVRYNNTNVVFSPTGVPFPVRGIDYRNEDYPENSEPDPIEEEETDEPEEIKKLRSMDLGEFIEIYKEAIARTVTESYAPIYQPSQPSHRPLPKLIRSPIGAQEHALRGAVLSMQVNQGTVIVGEMGTGKTYIGAAAAHMGGFRNILVLCPPHLVRKWKREIEMTVPGAMAAIVRTITDLERLREQSLITGTRFTIMSREAAKLSYWWEPAYISRQTVRRNVLIAIHCPECFHRILNENGTNPTLKEIQESPPQCPKCGIEVQNPQRRLISRNPKRDSICCPGCFKEVSDKEGLPVLLRELEKKRMKCPLCERALWQPMVKEHQVKCPCPKCTGIPGKTPRYRNRRYALAEYVKKRMKGFFDLLIADEVHEYKGRGTAQGIAAGNLAQICGKSLTLTGTLTGGYSSTLFHLLYRFTPEIRNEFKHNDQSRWIDRYGFRLRKHRKKAGNDDPYEHGRGSGRRGYRTTEKETPGLAPAALFHIIGNTVFLRLHDVTDKLPPYEEVILVQDMSRKIDEETGYSQKAAYEKLYRKLRKALQEALSQGSTRLMAAYLQSLLAYPDGCTRGETVIDPETNTPIVSIPPLSEEEIYPKEKTLIDLVKEEKAAGRRVLVYVTHTDTRDITPRIEEFLNKEGVKTAVLKSNSVKSEKREEWVNQRVKEKVDVLICNPRLVQTGLELVDFPTLVWYETDYSVYTMRQASRRSWRIGQDQPVKVVFMVYEGTIQTDALKLVAKKMQSSLAVEGELPEEGLTTFGDDGQDLIMTLAKQIVNEDGFQAGGSLENIFTKAKEAEQESERYLVDDSWDIPAPDPEPEPELEPAPEQMDLELEPAKPSSFSWTEFMAKPVEKTKRRRKKVPEAPSLFQWAVEQETTEQIDE